LTLIQRIAGCAPWFWKTAANLEDRSESAAGN